MRVPNRVSTRDSFAVSTPSSHAPSPQGGDGTFVVPDVPNPGAGGNVVPVVYFYDRSTGSPSEWVWQFYDSNDVLVASSTERNPVITFARAGEYFVTLTTDQGSVSKELVVR